MSLAFDQLLLFTRFPCAGRNKTRLIPALGAEGAALLHDRLVRHTLGRAVQFCSTCRVELVIRLDGGTAEDGMKWLGSYQFEEQGAGDLGARLDRAVRAAFDQGARRVVVIGSDCPELDTSILAEAFDLLEESAVVFGPAKDGGYYLVGLSILLPEIFQDIAWGGPEVLEQSLAAVARVGLEARQLKFLADVDLPEDLAAAETALAGAVEP